jgi:RNA polymerase sigma-70 factor (ECF subfamily)
VVTVFFCSQIPQPSGARAESQSSSFFCARAAWVRQHMLVRTEVTRAAPTSLHAVRHERSAIAGEPNGPSERELFEMVYGRMRALAHGASDFDDLVQLAAEQVFRSLPSFDGRSELRTWVFGVCYRVLLSQRRWYWRFRQRFISDSVALETSEDTVSPSAHEALESEQRLELLRRTLRRMGDKYRVVIVLYYLEGIETEQIARIVRSNERTVRSRLRDGRKQLLKLLGPDARQIFVERTP